MLKVITKRFTNHNVRHTVYNVQ